MIRFTASVIHAYNLYTLPKFAYKSLHLYIYTHHSGSKCVTSLKFDLVSDYIDSLEAENEVRDLKLSELDAHNDAMRQYFMPR